MFDMLKSVFVYAVILFGSMWIAKVIMDKGGHAPQAKALGVSVMCVILLLASALIRMGYLL